MESLRAWLKRLRLDKGLTQAEIAEMSNIDVTTVSKIELGERRPSPEVAKALASILGFRWTRFFEDDEQETSTTNHS